MNDIKLNQYLIPEDSPMARHQGQVSSYKFDYENEAGVISTSKIRNAAIGNAQIGTAAIGTANIGTLSFNEISGGTATLGGTTNGNGVLRVLDSSGAAKVVADNTGLTINDGSITIYNTAGSAAVDSLGVVSLNGFRQSSSVLAGGQVFSGTSEANVTGGSLTIVTTRSVVIEYLYQISGYLQETVGDTGNFLLRLKNQSNTVKGELFFDSGNVHRITTMGHSIETISAGTTTIRLTGQLSSVIGTPNFNVYDYRLSYIILGT